MREKSYYSIRTGKNPNAKLDLQVSRGMFYNVYSRLNAAGYFQEAFGYFCVDAGDVSGTLGGDVEAYVSYKLRKSGLWPVQETYEHYSEDDLFDMIELLYDCVSKPIDGYFHSFSNCGWHYNSFDQSAGRHEFRGEVNAFLRDYKDGYELSEDGEILVLADIGQEQLLEADLPEYNPANVEERVIAAISKFRRSRSSLDDRRDAVRDLADVLEFLRPKLKEVLTKKDESDLFNIANSFGVRHHNEQQQTDYDRAIWYTWMFYYYLATIHASLRLIKKHEDGLS